VLAALRMAKVVLRDRAMRNAVAVRSRCYGATFGRAMRVPSMVNRQWMITLLTVSSGCTLLPPAERDSKREAEQTERSTCPLERAPHYPTEMFERQY
jgi:hypothetical protein